MTIMDADFNGRIDSGNFYTSISDIEYIKIKRRNKESNLWVTLKKVPISSANDLLFSYIDNLAKYGEDYEYAIVPINRNGTEMEYISDEITSQFNGVFIADNNTIYKFFAGVSYDAIERVQKVGVFEVLGRKYPIVVSNGEINYDTGKVSGTVLPSKYFSSTDKVLDSIELVKERKTLKDFLTNKKAKILKDWNGNMWLVFITGNPNTLYLENSGMKLAKIDATWTEIGDADNPQDLYRSGLTEGAD